MSLVDHCHGRDAWPRPLGEPDARPAHAERGGDRHLVAERERAGTRTVMVVGNNWEGTITVIDFAREEVVAEVPVGDHPQRVREGRIRESVIDLL